MAGSSVGNTKITVNPPKLTGNSYKYKTSATEIAAPVFGDTTLSGYSAWNGTADITATDGHYVGIVECDASGAADKFGMAVAVSAAALGELTVTSEAGTADGDTKLTVSPAIGEGNAYLVKVSESAITLPLGNVGVEALTGYVEWNGTDDLTAATGSYVAVLEVTAPGLTVKGGTATVTAKEGGEG